MVKRKYNTLLQVHVTPRKNVTLKEPENLQQLSWLIELDGMHMKCPIHMFGSPHRLEPFLEEES
jgi:hypothetical protein